MLVCNVSLRPPRVGITAEIAETAVALDDFGTGNIVFATLVDDPASVGEIVDAYLGEIMVEAASVSDTFQSGLSLVSDIAETLTAADTYDSTITTIVTFATWDSATVSAVTLSAGDLVATSTGTTSTNQGAHVAAAAGKTSGKYYFELTFTANTGGNNHSVGIGTTASTYPNMGTSATVGAIVLRPSGNIWVNGTNTGSTLGTSGSGISISIAVDLDNLKVWFRKAPSGNWNGSGTANPATNVGGFTMPSGTMVPFCMFGGTGGAINNVITANFGSSTFVGAVPSGFTSGWPV